MRRAHSSRFSAWTISLARMGSYSSGTVEPEWMPLSFLTPIPFLVDVISSKAFGKGQTFTDFIDRHFSSWCPSMTDIDLVGLAYVADRLAGGGIKRETAETEADRSSPWATLGHFRP